MNLIRSFVLLASISVGQASHSERKLRDGPAVDGTCGFDAPLQRALDTLDFPDACEDFCDWNATSEECANESCGDGVLFCICQQATCEDIDVIVDTTVIRPQTSLLKVQGSAKFFVDLAVYNPGEPEDSLICLSAKGYQGLNEEPTEQDPVRRSTVHGHVLLSLLKDVDETGVVSVTNLKDAPCQYWCQGGSLEQLSEGCVKPNPDVPRWECDSFQVTKANGKWIDTCAEMGSAAPTHCTPLAKNECKKVNTCVWLRDTDECKYKSPWTGELLPVDTPTSTTTEHPPTTSEATTTTEPPPASTETPEDECAQYDNRGQCEKAGCHWDKKASPKCSADGESYPALSNIKEADAKAEQPSTGYATTAVSAWAIVPTLLLWFQL